jgi:subtilisin
VEEIFPNELRSIQPQETQAEVIAPAARAFDEGPVRYLRGLHDGLGMALAALDGRVFAPQSQLMRIAQAPLFADTQAMTWGLQAVGITAATRWTGNGIKVAVLDTGIDLEHADFAGRFVDGGNARSFVPGEQSAQDLHGHGTHCTGTVTGPPASQFGRRYGVAPEADIMIGRVLNAQGQGFDEAIIAGLSWAIEQGARIVSMSLGSVRAKNAPYSNLYERLAGRVISENPGTLLVAAAGNESRRPAVISPVGNPAACPSIMAVAAVDAALGVAPFSCGTQDGIGRIDIAAPGVKIYSAIPGGVDGTFNGTSMATPHVAGIAALYMQAFPTASASEVWDRMIRSARVLGNPADLGAGLVQAPA